VAEVKNYTFYFSMIAFKVSLAKSTGAVGQAQTLKQKTQVAGGLANSNI
jgi:hypothetical protein